MTCHWRVTGKWRKTSLVRWHLVFCVARWIHSITCHEGTMREQRFRSTLSLTSALDVGWVINAAPRQLYPQYPLYRRLVGSQGRCGRVRKISPPRGFDRRTVQPVASRYTDWAITNQLFCLETRRIFRQLCETHTYTTMLKHVVRIVTTAL